jgi:hypothetical protein
MKKLITTWKDNGMIYTLFSEPIIEETETKNFVTVFEYLNRYPPKGLGLRIYLDAKQNNEPIQYTNITSKNYQGRIAMYRREYLEHWFANNDINDQSIGLDTDILSQKKSLTETLMESDIDDRDLPF